MSRKILSDADREKYNANRRKKHEALRVPREILPDGFKRCSKCKKLKPKTTEYFSRHKEWFQCQCKECHNQYHLEHREETMEKNNKRYRERHPLVPKEVLPDGTKRCTQCGELKLASENFGPSKRNKSGYRPDCTQCRKEYYQNNSEAIIDKSHKYYKR